MNYDKDKLNNIIDDLITIKEYDCIYFPTEDELKVDILLNVIKDAVDKLQILQDSNYGY